MARARKVKWACKLFIDRDRKWCNIAKSFFKNICMQDFITTAYHEAFIHMSIPTFYRQCLIALSEVYPNDDIDVDTIRSLRIWLNKSLWQGYKPFFYKVWYEKGVKYLYQILNEKGFMIDVEKFFRIYIK